MDQACDGKHREYELEVARMIFEGGAFFHKEKYERKGRKRKDQTELA